MTKTSVQAEINAEITIKLDPAHFWTLWKLIFEGSEAIEKTTEKMQRLKTLTDELHRIKETLERIGCDEDWYQAEKWL